MCRTEPAATAITTATTPTTARRGNRSPSGRSKPGIFRDAGMISSRDGWLFSHSNECLRQHRGSGTFPYEIRGLGVPRATVAQGGSRSTGRFEFRDAPVRRRPCGRGVKKTLDLAESLLGKIVSVLDGRKHVPPGHEVMQRDARVAHQRPRLG